MYMCTFYCACLKTQVETCITGTCTLDMCQVLLNEEVAYERGVAWPGTCGKFE